MPFKPKKKFIPRKPKRTRKPRSKYRGTVARIPRALPLKPKSVCQKLVYYNTLHCIPSLDQSAVPQQQNYYFTIGLNTPWPFIYQWDDGASTNGKHIVPNTPIIALDSNSMPTGTTTAMPGLKDGYNLFRQYQNGLVVGTKVVISAQPTGKEDGDSKEQSGVLYAVKHAKVAFGLSSGSTVTDIQKLPFRQMKRVAGQIGTGSMPDRNTGARITVKHSPKTFNNVSSLRDNERFQFKQASGAHLNGVPPEDNDFLTIGVVPALTNFYDGGSIVPRKTCNLKLSLRIEQTILFTEPLENLGEGTGNYSLPWDASRRFASSFMRQTLLMG